MSRITKSITVEGAKRERRARMSIETNKKDMVTALVAEMTIDRVQQKNGEDILWNNSLSLLGFLGKNL